MKQKITYAYLGIWLLFAIYGWLWGQFKYESFFYSLGRTLLWPAIIFPALGQAIAAIVVVVFVAAILIFGKNDNN